MFTENDVICGSLLGDGCIKTPTIERRNICKANCWFSKSQCRKYEEYLKWHVDKIPLYNNIYDYTYGSAYIENGKVKVDKTITKIGYCLSSSADIQYTYLRNKWYPSGKKIVPKDLLLTPEMLAIWYCDDGYNIQNHKRAGICSQSFTHDECIFLSKEIDNLVGIKSHVIPSNQIMIYSKQYFIFMEFIKPYIIWDCMKYKCDISNVKALSYSSGEKHHNAKLDWKKVEHIRSLNGLSISELSILYKVSKKTIKNVIAGKVWKAEKGLAEEAEKMESII